MRAKMSSPTVMPIDLVQVVHLALNGPTPLGRLIIQSPSRSFPSPQRDDPVKDDAVRVYLCGAPASLRPSSRAGRRLEKSEPVSA